MAISAPYGEVRAAKTADIAPLSRIWFEGWHLAHRDTLPAELRQYRTEASFAVRLEAALGDVRVLVRDGQAGGFALLRAHELNQLYVARALIGTGAAQTLIADAEATLRARGFDMGILNCAEGNERAIRFYERSGWANAGLVDVEVDAGGRPFPLRALRFEKRL